MYKLICILFDLEYV
ncbi:hypothetical protein F383_36228 [Gossypium arboreum]|uniref:Uncharacterized protein n=1 Tax=Gossypium arboreum TaxID=29729 RepID=A0A0B0N300_GOSAR|nr:hypothetical protein F383_36228 [Gossypium arboreum]